MRFERRQGRNAWGAYDHYIAIDNSGHEIRFDLAELGADTVQLWAGELRWAKYDRQGNRVAQGTTWSTAPTTEDLTAMDAVARHLVPFRHTQRGCYIRFGNIPKGGRSRNHATGEYEKGVSCYEACYNPFTQAWELAGSALPAAAIMGAAGLYGQVWLISGEVVGQGSDGEPLLTDVKKIAGLRWDDEVKGYRVERGCRGV